jgi:hypothetical protein
MSRGQVLGLTLAQVAARARYLGGLAKADTLDAHVRDAAPDCIDGYYLLSEHNGGKDPTAKDPFDRWSKVGHTFVNRTADCIGGASWCGGFDRYQPDRFAHLYDGWINTDSMIEDALGPGLCFELLHAPVPGCFMVAPTHAPPPFAGCGHIATVYDAPPESDWNPESHDCWRHVLAVDVAARGEHRANMPTTGVVWEPARYTPANPHHFAIFCHSIMEP